MTAMALNRAYDPLSGLDWGSVIPKDVIAFHFYPEGSDLEADEVDLDGDGEDDDELDTVTQAWTDFEKAQFLLAFELFSRYLNVEFVQVATAAEADLKLARVSETDIDDSLGMFFPPGDEYAGLGLFSSDGRGWQQLNEGTGLLQGGYGFVTIIHELGHGLGLAHPHDTGGKSTVFPGVTQSKGETGDFGLNDQVYTMMSYNDGWFASPFGQPKDLGYGWVGTPMAFDLALLQSKYGANPSYNADDTVYELADANEPGTFYEVIWDTGGIDTMRYKGERDVVINLKAASLAHEVGGGGWVSYAQGVHGGYTIAHGVVIENIVSGSGNDLLIGNHANNMFTPGAGNNRVEGGGGLDTVLVQASAHGVVVSRLADAVEVVSELATDTLVDIERVVFNDRTLAFDLDGVVGEVVLLYQGALGRAAEEAGLGYWVGVQAQNAGFGSLDLAINLMSSAEYAQRGLLAPEATDAVFLDAIYQGMLGREADAKGQAFWEGVLAEGLSRAQVLVAFTETTEAQAVLQPLAETGVWMV